MKLHRVAIVLVVLLTTSTVAATAAVSPADDRADAAASQAKVTLTVTVTDDFNSGISDVKLTAHWDGGSATARTASNGKAFVDVRQGADVRLYVNHSSYTLNNPVVVRDADERDVAIEVFRRANARVTVVDGGTSIADARVVMFKEGEDRPAAEGRTGDDGVFESTTVEQGSYRVVAVKEGFLENETTVEVRGTTEATVAISESTVTVDVSVADDHFDSPKAVEGATVEIEGATSASLSTSGSGTATIGLPVNAQFTVTVTKDGYTTAERTIVVRESSRSLSFTITREPALTVEAVNQRVVVGEKVQLTVTNEYGERVEGASVLVDGQSVGTTDADGVYRASIDDAGEHTITAKQGGITSGEVTVEGVSAGVDSTPSGTATTTGTAAPASLPDFSQPSFVMKIGVAAVGVLIAFVVVRRLL